MARPSEKSEGKDGLLFPCELCHRNFQNGPQRYDGHGSQRYSVFVCDSCWEGNWDGWNPMHERFLLARLKEKGLPIPERNEKGWLPRE